MSKLLSTSGWLLLIANFVWAVGNFFSGNYILAVLNAFAFGLLVVAFYNS